MAELQGKMGSRGADAVVETASAAEGPSERDRDGDARDPGDRGDANVPPPEPVVPRSTLRPGESVVRSNGSGIVIRRERRIKNRT